MGKIIGILIAGVVVFVGTLAGALAVTGKLNADTLAKLMGGKEAAHTESAAAPQAELGPLSTKIKEEQERLRARERELDERESQLEQREAQLEQTLAEVTKLQEEVNAAFEQADAEHQARILQIAKTMEKMDPKNAAIDLAAMTPEDAAIIVPLITDRSRGKILDEMLPEPRAQLLEVLQEKKL